MSPEYAINAPKEGVSMSCLSAMLLTIKFGAFPMYVKAPIKTDPQEIAANKLCPASDFTRELRFSALPPTNPEAIAAKVMYVGALSRMPESNPVTQKKCQGALRPNVEARALRISNAGTIVTNTPRNNAAISKIGEK